MHNNPNQEIIMHRFPDITYMVKHGLQILLTLGYRFQLQLLCERVKIRHLNAVSVVLPRTVAESRTPHPQWLVTAMGTCIAVLPEPPKPREVSLLLHALSEIACE